MSNHSTLRRYLWRYEVKRTRAAVASDSLAHYEARQLAHAGAVAVAFRAIVGDAPREHFLAFYLDNCNRIMGYETIAIGGCASVAVEPAQVFRGALIAGAVQLIVAHNHPSGNPSPSDDDINLTEKLAQVARLIGIPLLDHVIVTTDGSHSFASAGKL